MKFFNQSAINSYQKDYPRYIVLDNLFDVDFIKKCSRDFLEINEKDFVRYDNRFFEFEKYTLNNEKIIPESILSLFKIIHSEEFVSEISAVTGVEDLRIDPSKWGGGLHMTKKGGYLSIHKDFNVLPTTYKEEKQMLRCINIIGYINEDWKKGDGGELEFWDEEGKECILKIEPKFNRWVIFDTRSNFHGHPYPYEGDSPRISIASYYYTSVNTKETDWMSTVYLKLPWMEDNEDYKKMRIERADSKIRYSNLR